MNGKGICVVGFGGNTAIGATVLQSSAAFRAGISQFVTHPYMRDRAGAPVVIARATHVPTGLTWLRRMVALTVPAIHEALAGLSPRLPFARPIPMFVGLPGLRPGMPREWVNVFDAELRKEVLPVKLGEIQHDCNSHVSGVIAFAQACRCISEGLVDAAIVGGCESYLTRHTLEWLDATEQLHSSIHKSGFIPGEGAGICLLTSIEIAKKYSLPVLGQIDASGSACETSADDENGINVGLGLTAAVRQTLSALEPGRRIENVLNDLNGQRHRFDEYGFMLVRLSSRFADPSVFDAPACAWGDIGAASAPLCVGLAIAAAHRGYSRGETTLITASSETEQRGALLVRTARIEQEV